MQLSQLELQNLRHLIGSHATAEKKLTTYAQHCQDQELRQMFQQSAQSACDTHTKLCAFLK